MRYKYQKGQILGKRLKVPKHILTRIYNCTLSFEDFIKYDLEDKIPTSCIAESDRVIVDKFGLDKAKDLDWELLNTINYLDNIDFRRVLMSQIDASEEDVNRKLYELTMDNISFRYYSSKMKELYKDRLFELDDNDDYYSRDRKEKFNRGRVSLVDLIYNWDFYKEKNLDYCLMKDIFNKEKINDQQLRELMDNYGVILNLLDNDNIYSFVNGIIHIEDDEEKKKYIKIYTDKLLDRTRKKDIFSRNIYLTDSEYKEIFKYSSLGEYFMKVDEYRGETLAEELKSLPDDYIFNIPIPFEKFLDKDILTFVSYFGLQNVVDFDNECGHIFTKDNCLLLSSMYDMYMHYGDNINDPERNIYVGVDGQHIGRGKFSKDQFYEAMRRMIVYGPTDGYFHKKGVSYRDVVGEFRVRYPNLFISEDAPEELQELFYTKKITPQVISEHPEYIEFLRGKDLSSCFESRDVTIVDSDSVSRNVNFYKFIEEKTDFDTTMKFISEHSDIMSILFNLDAFDFDFRLYSNSTIEEIDEYFVKSLRKIIIEKKHPYPKNIPESFKKIYPSMFLSDDAPDELKDAFYSRTISFEFLSEHKEFLEYLKDVDLELLTENMMVSDSSMFDYKRFNLLSGMEELLGREETLDIMLSYGKYIEKVYKLNGLRNFNFSFRTAKYDWEDFKSDPDIIPPFTDEWDDSTDSFDTSVFPDPWDIENPFAIGNFPNYTPKERLIDEFDSVILSAIRDNNMYYSEDMPSHFKEKHPEYFLDENVPQDIKDKFYGRNFTIEDFIENPDLIDIFDKTSIVLGFPSKYHWIDSFFEIENIFSSTKINNMNKLKLISEFAKIDDVALQDAFKSFIINSDGEIDFDKIEDVSIVLKKLSKSNSSEIFAFREQLARQILSSDDPMDSLNKIDDLFTRNNIPTMGKLYSCLEILHPDFRGFDFEYSMVSPTLKRVSTKGKKIIVFADLIKASFGSNNQSIKSYLNNIEEGSKLYKDLKSGVLQYDELNDKELKELITFSKHLVTLYNNSTKGKKSQYNLTDNVIDDIDKLVVKLSPDGTTDYDLGDRVIKMFCHFGGFDSIEDAKRYIDVKVREADSRNRLAAQRDMTLEEGDFVKGIVDIRYLRNILQNGSVSKEFLGADASSDLTPLDTDVSMVLSSEGSVRDKIDSTAASSYGPIWFVLKHDDRFMVTRTATEDPEFKRDLSKLEVFYTGASGKDHYGIRTGFASSEINYIVMSNFDPRVGLEIAMNGFYIPIADKSGKIIFTPKDYDKLREKMSGLSYFGENSYHFSDNLVNDEIYEFVEEIEQNILETESKREKINKVISEALDELGLQLKTDIDGDLSEGYVELIDTGSTGRGTNKPGDGDFDFMMRVDRSIISNPTKFKKLQDALLKRMSNSESSTLTYEGDFRLKKVSIDGINADVDITFITKTDKISYSTDMAIKDRLDTIKEQDPEKYKYVLANILLAKKVLKEAGVYKPDRGENPQGGLGGVGIENWILQNGGSFEDAARSFVEAAEGKDFNDFKREYQVWDFGENHLAEKRGHYPHDNFVFNNMSADGYEKMVNTLSTYLKTLETKKTKKTNL